MLYNIRAAFTAALAFLAVPSIANPDAAQIIASLNGLSSELTDLKTTCSSDGSQGGKGGYIGGGGGGAGFSYGVRDTSNLSVEQSLTRPRRPSAADSIISFPRRRPPIHLSRRFDNNRSRTVRRKQPRSTRLGLM